MSQATARDTKHTYFVFFGTQTALVRATDEDAAFDVFVALAVGTPSGAGRYMPPTRDEVRIRRPVPSDRDWIEDSGEPKWLAVLKEMEAAQ